MKAKLLVLGTAILFIAGCAVRLGGPKPVEYRAVALSAAAGVAPDEIATLIQGADANVVLLAAEAEPDWFDEVARQASLSLSGPGTAGPVGLAFLASEAVGDTTIALKLPDGDEVVIHDALYEVDDHRYLDLMALRISSATRVRESIKALLSYVASDVMPQAAVVLAIDVPDSATGDSIAGLLSPVFRDVRSCLGQTDDESTETEAGMRLFYGPEARLRCESARPLAQGGSPLIARLIVGR